MTQISCKNIHVIPNTFGGIFLVPVRYSEYVVELIMRLVKILFGTILWFFQIATRFACVK